MSGNGPNPKIWGRRLYADKAGRELLNEVSQYIARIQPDDVDDPADPAVSDLLRHAGTALDVNRETHMAKGAILSNLMAEGLDFQEAICWYWFRYCRFDITEIHYGITGHDSGGDPAQRRESVRNIMSVLKSAATKLPDVSSDDVPDMVDERKRHDRTDDIAETSQ